MKRCQAVGGFAVCVLLWASGLNADSPGYLKQLSISGSWQPQGGGVGVWQQEKGRLRLTIPPKSTQAYEIRRAEPPPDGDWTAHFWCYQPDGFTHTNVTFFVGDAKSPDSALELTFKAEAARAEVNLRVGKTSQGTSYLDSGVGVIQWVRIAYSPKQKRVAASINGQTVPCRADNVTLPRASWGLRVQRQHPFPPPVRVVIASFQVERKAQLDDTSRQGQAFQGWQTMGRNLLPPNVNQRLQALYKTPGLSEKGRMHTLAAMLLSERASQRRASEASWKEVGSLFDRRGTPDAAAASVLLPIAIACADAKQRTQARTWVQKHFETLPVALRGIFDGGATIKRSALLDPARAVDAAQQKTLSHSEALPIAESLVRTAPDRALALYCHLLAHSGNSGWDTGALAWLLPELRAAAPNYATLAMEYLREFSRKTDSLNRSEPDRTLSFAAYRLARVDAPAASDFLNQIRNPEVRADTLELMMDSLAPLRQEKAARLIEVSLKQSVAAWKPTKSNDSPVPQLVRLAQWQASAGRKADAQATLNQAKQKVGQLPGTKFRDIFAIAKLMRDLQRPEAATWWKKAQAAATALDQARKGPDQSGGISIAATTLVVRELVKDNKIEDALAMTQKLNRELLSMNYVMCMEQIVPAIGRADFPRALKLLKQMPEGSPRNGTVSRLAAVVAPRNFSAAVSLLDEVPPSARVNVALSIGRVVPIESSEKLLKIVGEALSTHLSQPRRGVEFGMARFRLREQLSRLPLSTLLALEPYFKSNRETFAQYLWVAVGRACGLQNDPLWQRLAEQAEPKGEPIPWGSDRLRYAVVGQSARR